MKKLIASVLIIPLAILFIPAAVWAQDVSGNQQPGTGALRPVKNLQEDAKKEESNPEKETLEKKIDSPSVAPSSKPLGRMTDEPEVTIIYNRPSPSERQQGGPVVPSFYAYEKPKPQEERLEERLPVTSAPAETKPVATAGPAPSQEAELPSAISPTSVRETENAPSSPDSSSEPVDESSKDEDQTSLENPQPEETAATTRMMGMVENSITFYEPASERMALKMSASEPLMAREMVAMNAMSMSMPMMQAEKVMLNLMPTIIAEFNFMPNTASLPTQALLPDTPLPSPQEAAVTGEILTDLNQGEQGLVNTAAAAGLPGMASPNLGSLLNSQLSATGQNPEVGSQEVNPANEMSDTGIIKTIERAKTVMSAEKIQSGKIAGKTSGIPEKGSVAPTWLEVLQSHIDKGNISDSNPPQGQSSQWCVSFADSDGITEMIQRGYAQSGGPGEYAPQGPKNLYSYGNDENRIMFITVVELNVDDQPVKAARIFADGRVYVFSQLKKENFNSPPDRREGTVNYAAPVVLFAKVTDSDLGTGYQITGALKASSILKTFMDKGRSAPKVPCPKK